MGIVDYIEQKNKERVRRARMEDAKKVSLGLVLGALAGSAAGLLFAPQSGKKTRQDIVNATKDAAETVRDKTDEVVQKAKDLYSEHIEGRLTSIGAVANEAKEATKEAAKDVKKGVEDAKEDVKKGAEDAKKRVEKNEKEMHKDEGKSQK